MRKIIYIYPQRSSFISLDLNMLSNSFEVVEDTGSWHKVYMLPFLFLKQFFFLILNIRGVDSLISSFGGYWSVLPVLLGKLFGKPVYIILHGTDCAGFQEINYGNLRKPYMKFALGISYKYATKLLPVSKSLIYTENTYYSDNKIKQGIDYFYPKLNTPKEIIPNVFDSEKWKNLGLERVANRFITVLGKGQFVRKGGELIIQIAKEFPNHEFWFIGLEKPNHLIDLPQNVTFVSRLTPEELLQVYNQSPYYLQLSIFEGFGCALCEAMLCGCIPIVANANVLPQIVGETGYVLKRRKVSELKELLKQVINECKSGVDTRNQIIKNYPLELREQLFKQILQTK